jgi:hypothetical protein
MCSRCCAVMCLSTAASENDKTEIILYVSRAGQTHGCRSDPSEVLCELFDVKLSMKQHAAQVVTTCVYCLCHVFDRSGDMSVKVQSV